ncbi:MAG: fumarylacetoacetate hydrolase family protein [Gammaproteobacteria bacterium]|nr:fumarylacetoacetate hydrolase family protein [Gammaproteobacteria bacterium]
MAIPLVRYQLSKTRHDAPARWGVPFDGLIAPLPGDYATTGDVVRAGQAEARALTRAQATVTLDEVRVLSPVTGNQQFLCQGVNYESHVRESGLDPADLPFNTIFTKASSCLSGPYDDVVRPPHVQLLDYEIELGLVLGRDLAAGTTVHPDQLHEVLAGVTIVNDITARDVQLPQGQFYKGKSYRTFGPAGPLLLLLEPDEWRRWPELHMRLAVNGQPRQDAYCREMLHKPHQTLTELGAMHDVHAGDLVATGTPAGCAAKAPGKLAMFVTRHFVSDATKWKLFVKAAQRNPLYLQPGDVIELAIRTDDGKLDLGTQRTRVVAA